MFNLLCSIIFPINQHYFNKFVHKRINCTQHIKKLHASILKLSILKLMDSFNSLYPKHQRITGFFYHFIVTMLQFEKKSKKHLRIPRRYFLPSCSALENIYNSRLPKVISFWLFIVSRPSSEERHVGTKSGKA